MDNSNGISSRPIEGERVTNSAALPLDPLWGAAVVLGAAAFIRWGDAWVYHWAYRVSPPGMAGIVFVNLVSVAWYAWPVVFIVALLHGAKALGEELGLQQGVGPGVGYALLFTLPMSVGYALLGEVAKVAPSVLVVNQLRAAFREELFYRAFLFGACDGDSFRPWGAMPCYLPSVTCIKPRPCGRGSAFSPSLGSEPCGSLGSSWSGRITCGC